MLEVSRVFVGPEDIFGSWINAEWYGSIKPSTDMLKQVKASGLLVAGGYSTRAREARGLTGTKYTQNIKRLKRENLQLVDAMRPMAEFEQEFEIKSEANNPEALADAVLTALEDSVGGDKFLELVDTVRPAGAGRASEP